jgi:uncharacterized protein YndB with AHSA1/START domain
VPAVAAINIVQEFRVSAEQVFDALADQENSGSWMGAKISVAARGEHGLVGTVRRVHLGPTHFEERILEAERPRHIGYAIVSTVPGLVRHRGDVYVQRKGEEQAEVTWRVDMVLRPALLTMIVRALLSFVIARALKRLDRQLSARA